MVSSGSLCGSCLAINDLRVSLRVLRSGRGFVVNAKNLILGTIRKREVLQNALALEAW